LAYRKKVPLVGNRDYEVRGYNGLSARNGQRHITRVMFSAVVHQSMTATSTVKIREMDDDQSEQETGGGQAKALPGVGIDVKSIKHRHEH
jgi:hypothetical protein